MKDDEIRAHLDGRGRVELLPGHATPSKQRWIGGRSPTRSATGYSPPRASAVSASGLSTNATTPRTRVAGQSRPWNGYARAARGCQP